MAIDSLKTAALPPATSPLPASVTFASREGTPPALRTLKNRVGEEFDFFLMTESASRQQEESVRQNIDTMLKQSAPVKQSAPASVSVADATPVSFPSPASAPVFASASVSDPASVSAAVPAAIATAKSSPVPPNPLVEENLLILDVKAEKLGLESSLLGYGTEDANFLPLGQIAKDLAFNLDIDPQSGKADGWFIEEGRKFQLDTRAQTLRVDGKNYPWQEGKIYSGDDDIYIENALLSEIFPVNFNLSTSMMELHLDPREKLPLQLQYEREQRRQELDGGDDMRLRYPLRKNEYDFFSFPRIDINTGMSFSAGNNSDFSLPINYSVQMSGDIAWMDADLFLAGNSRNGASSLRGSLSRYNIEGELLGPLQATKFSLGDISPTSLTIIPSAGMERGITLTNMPLDRSDSFDTTRFEGSLPTGWDVELYQGSSLIASQQVGADNFYSFKDISLHYGKNDFRLIGYGPQGQKRILKEQTLTVGSNMIKPGDFEYAFSVSDVKHNLFPIGDNKEKQDEDFRNPRITGKFSYGISKALSVNGGISSVEFENKRHNYLQTGVAGTLSSLYGRGDLVVDSESGAGLSLQALTTLNDINFSLRQDWYSSDMMFEGVSQPQQKTRASISGTTPGFDWLPPINCNLRLERSQASEGEDIVITNRLSTNFKGIQFINTLGADLADIDSSIAGNAAFRWSGWGRQLHGNIDYILGRERQITGYSLGGDWWLDNTLSLGADIFHYPEENHSKFTADLNWDTGSFILTPSVSYDTNGDFMAAASLSFSLGREPLTREFTVSSEGQAGQGGVTAFVYNDVNNNGIYDQGDKSIEDVKIVSHQQREDEKTKEEGVAFFPFLSPHKATDIEIDSNTLADPAWQTPVKGVAIAPRPGHIEQVEIPVVSTGELDGSIYVIDDNGRPVELSGLTLELVDDNGEVQQTTVSEYDGFYLFDKIFPGEYTLRIKEDGKEAAPHYEKRVTVGNNGDIISGNDIVLFNGRAYTPAPDLLERGLVPPANPETSRFIAKLDTALPEKEKAVKEEKPSPVPLRKKSANQLLEEALRRASYPRIQPGSNRPVTMEQMVPQSTAKAPVRSNLQPQEKLQPIEDLQQVEEEIAIVAMSDPQLQPQVDKRQRYSRARQAALASLGISPSPISGSDGFSGSSIGPIGRPIKGFIPIASPVKPLAPVTDAASSSRVVAVSHAANTYASFQAG